MYFAESCKEYSQNKLVKYKLKDFFIEVPRFINKLIQIIYK